jgi:hypothetical protein
MEAAIIRQFSVLQVVYGLAGADLIASGSRSMLAEVADVAAVGDQVIRVLVFRVARRVLIGRPMARS